MIAKGSMRTKGKFKYKTNDDSFNMHLVLLLFKCSNVTLSTGTCYNPNFSNCSGNLRHHTKEFSSTVSKAIPHSYIDPLIMLF